MLGFVRTKALVLELLAAVCLVSGGHEIILSAFDNFKEVSHRQPCTESVDIRESQKQFDVQKDDILRKLSLVY